MSNKKKNIFEQISTKPNYYSTVWKGKRSVLSTVFLWTIWFLRIFSLLQILKLIFRKTVTLLRKATKDVGSTRVNVPPVFVEIYYIFWLVFMTAGNVFSLFSVAAVRVISVYFLVESIIWVLYYTIFRRFYEESYSLYHILEYFVVLFILVPTQALALSGLYSYPFPESLAGIIGAANDSTPIIIRIMGALNAAIVVALIINSFPSEASKTSNKIQENFIIGFGDVVKNRLLPALKNQGTDGYAINIYDIVKRDAGEYNRFFTVIDDSETIIPHIEKKINNRSVIWIETPVSSHIKLLKQALKTDASLIAIEKPITDNREELDFVREIIQNDETRNRVFFLSYYLLEKALPLYFIADNNASYRKYLNISDSEIVLDYRNYIGNPVSAEVEIYEGDDDRAWTFDGIKGQLYETFLHNVIIASLFTGLPEYWKDTEINYNDGGEGKPKIITLTGKAGNASINLRQGKFIPPEQRRRYAKFVFENGIIYADFERKTANVEIFSLGRTAEVSVKDVYSIKYSVQTSLVSSVFSGANRSDDVDGLRNQLEIIKFFIDYLEKKNLQ